LRLEQLPERRLSHFGRRVRAGSVEPPSHERRISDEQRKPKFFGGLGKCIGSFYGCESLDQGQNREFRFSTTLIHGVTPHL